MHESTKKLLAPVSHEKTRIALLWVVCVFAIAFMAYDCFAQTPDWRPIHRVYKNDGVTVGNVGSAGQIKQFHARTAKSFRAIGTNLSWWNFLSDKLDGSTNARNISSGLTVGGTSGPWADASLVVAGNTVQYAGAFTAPATGVSRSAGVLLRSTDWTPASNTGLFGVYGSAPIKSWEVLVLTTGDLSLRASTTGSSYDVTTTVLNPGFTDGSWHSFDMVYDGSSMFLFIDGKRMASMSISTLAVPGGTPAYILGGTPDGTVNLTGNIREAYFDNANAYSASEIVKLSSPRIDHNKNLIAKRQDWHFKHQHLGTAGNPYQTLPFVWHDPTDANSLFADFSDLDATDKIDIRLYDLQQ